jgi:nicotinamidase-related amidase
MRDVVLIVDVLDDFGHADGDALLASFAERQEALVALLDSARARGVDIVYANDNKGVWDGDARRLVEVAVAGPGGELIGEVVPGAGERFVVKPRYSAFDHTPLELILRELECERLVIAGMTTEGCVTQSAIDARELGLKVTVVDGACATIDERIERIALRYLVEVAGVVLDDASLFGRDERADRPVQRTAAVT